MRKQTTSCNRTYKRYSDVDQDCDRPRSLSDEIASSNPTNCADHGSQTNREILNGEENPLNISQFEIITENPYRNGQGNNSTTLPRTIQDFNRTQQPFSYDRNGVEPSEMISFSTFRKSDINSHSSGAANNSDSGFHSQTFPRDFRPHSDRQGLETFSPNTTRVLKMNGLPALGRKGDSNLSVDSEKSTYQSDTRDLPPPMSQLRYFSDKLDVLALNPDSGTNARYYSATLPMQQISTDPASSNTCESIPLLELQPIPNQSENSPQGGLSKQGNYSESIKMNSLPKNPLSGCNNQCTRVPLAEENDVHGFQEGISDLVTSSSATSFEESHEFFQVAETDSFLTRPNNDRTNSETLTKPRSLLRHDESEVDEKTRLRKSCCSLSANSTCSDILMSLCTIGSIVLIISLHYHHTQFRYTMFYIIFAIIVALLEVILVCVPICEKTVKKKEKRLSSGYMIKMKFVMRLLFIAALAIVSEILRDESNMPSVFSKILSLVQGKS